MAGGVETISFGDEEGLEVVGTAVALPRPKPIGFVRAHLVWIAIAAAIVYWFGSRR
jgi:hypothetical protein